MLKTIIDGFTDLLYPPECPGCARRSDDGLVCSTCRLTFQDAGCVLLTAEPPNGVLPVAALWMFREREPIQRLMHRLKYANSPWIGTEIGAMLGEKLRIESTCRLDLVVPVPLHTDRRVNRGYNQSDWIARGVASSLGASVATDALARVRATRSQTKLSQNERLENVEGAFQVQSDAVVGRRVALIDDTVTTGATLMTAAGALVTAGALTVLPAAIAAAPLRTAPEPDPGFSVVLS